MNREQEHILVIRLSSLGDILLIAPALRALRRRFPEAQIDLLVAERFRDAAELLPGLSSVITFNTSGGLSELWRVRKVLSRRYSVLVDLQNSLRSSFLRTFSFSTFWVKAKRYRFQRWLLIRFKWNTYSKILTVAERYLEVVAELGGTNDGFGLQLRVPDSARDWCDGYLSQINPHGKRLAVLCPGAKHATKRWPLEKWRDLGSHLTADGFQIVLAGSISEVELIRDLADQLPDSRIVTDLKITEVAAILQRSAIVVTNDSGLMHVATGVGTPVAAIFGPTVAEFGFFPYRANSSVIEQRLSCRPCSAMGGPRCPKKHFRCMIDTSTETVLTAIYSLIPKA